MTSKSFLTGLFFVTLAGAVAGSGACGGNVVVDHGDCPSGKTSCSGVCIDTQTDDANCGACGVACGTGSCFKGQCVKNVGGDGSGGTLQGGSGVGGSLEDCPPGLQNCNGVCVDIYNDPQNCGYCGADCGPGAYCKGGGCVIPPQDCSTCAEFITNGDPPPCPGTSENLYENLINCVCAGACVYQCSDNVCTGKNITDACQTCVLDTMAGCGNEFQACSNDL